MTKVVRAFLVLCLSSALAHAEEQVAEVVTDDMPVSTQPVSHVLTWQECVALAAQNNPTLKASVFSMKASHADYKGSYNRILPQLSLSNSYSEGGRSRSTTPGTWSAQGTVSLDLIDFGEWAGIQSSLASYKQSQATVRTASSQTLLDLYRAFSGLLYAQELIQVNTAILSTWKTNAQMVNLRYQSGRESKGNNMNTHAQYLQAKAALEQAKRDLRAAQQTLNEIMGTEGFGNIGVTGTWETSAVPYPTPDFNALMGGNPRIQVQQAVVEQARAGIKSAHSSLWPALSLNYTRGATGSTEFPQNPFWTFSGAVSLPIFSGGPTAAYYSSVAAQRDYDSAFEDLRATKNQVRTDLESAWSGFASAEDQIQVQRAFLDAAKQRKEESDIRYQNGLMSFEDWNRVITDYVNLQTSFLRTQQDRVLAEAQWRFAKGDPL